MQRVSSLGKLGIMAMDNSSEHSGSPCLIGLDIGGSKLASGVVSKDGRLLRSDVVTMPRNAESAETFELIRRSIERLRCDFPGIQAIGVGVAGAVDWPSGYIRWAPNSGYRDFPLKDMLLDLTGLPTVVDNDANAAAWAEMSVGAGRGYDNLAVLTVGTGIGAGLVLDRRMYRGGTGLAGEFGHIIVDPDGAECGCGSTGCLEAMASGGALGRLGKEAAARDPESALARVAGSPDRVTGEIVYQVAQTGDHLAKSLFDVIGYWLGVGIASLVNLLDVELVVVGGGLSTTGGLLLKPAQATFESFLFSKGRRTMPNLIPAQLGNEAGVVGAGLLAHDLLTMHATDR